MKRALLVVDVQNDFCSGGALAVRHAELVIPPLNSMIRDFDEKEEPMFFSCDLHPHTTKHFKEYGGLWPMHCVRGTWGARFQPDLNIPLRRWIITKGKSDKDDGYSAFEGSIWVNLTVSARGEEISFAEHLRALSVQELYVGGLATDYCVKASVLDALKLVKSNDYLLKRVYLLTDACRAVNLKPGDEAKALNQMANAGAIFTSTDEVLRRL